MSAEASWVCLGDTLDALVQPGTGKDNVHAFLGESQPRHGWAQLISRVQGEENDPAVMTSRRVEKALSRSDGYSSYYGDKDNTIPMGHLYVRAYIF